MAEHVFGQIDVPATTETIALGRKFFLDGILSRDGKVSCASCHDARVGFSDSRTVSTGVDGLAGTRQGMVIVRRNYTLDLTRAFYGRAIGISTMSVNASDVPIARDIRPDLGALPGTTTFN